MRHAKSDWSAPGLSDHDRPLNDRGRADAPGMGTWLVENGLSPDLVLCSSAVRTRQTLDGLQAGGLEPGQVIYLQDLYLAGLSTTERLIEEYGGDHGSLMVLGHNPTSHELAMKLAVKDGGRTDSSLLWDMARKFPTSAVAAFRTGGQTWQQLSRQDTALNHYMTPKLLRPDMAGR